MGPNNNKKNKISILWILRSKRKIILTELLPFIAATPELGEELFGLATIVLNAALMGVDEAVAEAAPTGSTEPGLEPAGGVVTRGTCTGGTEATGDGGTLLTELTMKQIIKHFLPNHDVPWRVEPDSSWK